MYNALLHILQPCSAIMERWGRPAAELAEHEEVWELESDYIAQAVTNYILTLSPQKVILGSM